MKTPRITAVCVTPGRWIWFVRGQVWRQHYLTGPRVTRLFNRLARLPGTWHHEVNQIEWRRQP